MKKSPFFVGTYEPDNEYNQKRYAYSLGFVNELSGKVLDCGEPNLLKSMFEDRFSIEIESTGSIDLDCCSIEGVYDYILAFEIIEHLMNPLFFLQQIKSVLKKQGSLYLSTPINKPKFLWRHDHFHEFDDYRLNSLMEKAGFEIVRREYGRFYRINGIRPVIRWYLRSGTIFLELRHVDSN